MYMSEPTMLTMTSTKNRNTMIFLPEALMDAVTKSASLTKVMSLSSLKILSTRKKRTARK